MQIKHDALIDLDGLIMRRAELAGILPDLERFETYLSDAIECNRAMRANGGRPPAYTDDWTDEHRYRVVLTMQECGVLKMRAEAQATTGRGH